MAISTQTEALLEVYNQKISLDIKQLSQVNVIQEGYTIQTGIGSTDKIKVWGPIEVIEDYNFPIKKLDNKIIQLNNQISNIQSEILAIGQQANSVGCGTQFIDEYSVGYSTITVYQDRLNYTGYSFVGVNPFSPIGGALNSGNCGIGTLDYVSQVVIGTYLGPINICNRLDIFGGPQGPQGISYCTDQQCSDYASTVVNLTNQLAPLQSERNELIQKVNFLKMGRAQYEIQNYAYEQSKVQLNSSIEASNTIIGFLQDPNNEEWL
jgi:hypothetical protein